MSASAPNSDAAPAPGRFRAFAKLALVALIAVALLALGKALNLQTLMNRALDWVAGLGWWGPVIFSAIYVVSAALLIPGSALTLGAGAVFGLVQGTVIVSLASTLAAAFSFLIGRYLARDSITRRIEGHPKFAAIDRAVADEGWKIVFLTRLSPVFPYTLLNYAFGLTRVKLSHYVLASWIGMMPGTVMYVYLGTLAQAASGDRARTPGEWALYGVGLLATVVVTVFVTRIAKKALAQKVGE